MSKLSKLKIDQSLRDPSPPPKPPLPEHLCRSDPNTSITPPPLPPKKKTFRMQQLADDKFRQDRLRIASSLER